METLTLSARARAAAGYTQLTGGSLSGSLSAREYTPLSARDGTEILTQEEIREEDLDAAAEPDISDVLSAEVPAPLGVDRGATVNFSGVDIVQFSSPIYFVDLSQESYLMVDLIRLGSMRGEARVHFQTEDVDAKAGVRYIESSREIVFADGVSSQSVRVDILPGTVWTATLEFKLVVSKPVNCALGMYLKTARIKLMDSETFPSDRYRSLMENPESSLESVPGWGLLWEYIKLNFHVEGIAWRTVLTLVFDQLENAFLLLTLQLNIYLVDVVLNIKDPDTEQQLLVPSRAKTAMIIGGLFAVPTIAVHIWEYCRLKLRTAGTTRAFLQTNLFRKFMNYSEDSRRFAGNIDVDIVAHAPQVAECYMMALTLVKQLGKLLIMLGFMLHHSKGAWWVILLMPTLLLIYGALDPQDVGGHQSVILDKTKKVSTMVMEVTQKYELIADCFQRPRMNQMFALETTILNRALLDQGIIVLNFMMVPPHLGSIFTALWIAWKSQAVLSGEESLGTLLAMIAVFGKMAAAYDQFYGLALTFKAHIAVLRKLTRLFNLQTDLPFLKEVNRKRRALTKARRENALKEFLRKSLITGNAEFKRPITDTLPLEIRIVTFGYAKGAELLIRVNASTHQSSLVAITADHGGGRRTLMKLLALKLFPHSGMIAIPTHLRILHVSEEPIVLSLPAWENLTFACPDADPERVLKVLEMLDMGVIQKLVEEDLKLRKPHLLENADNEVYFGSEWLEHLSKSEKVKVHLARAFIMNPEVMVLQHPFKHFDEVNDKKVMSAIKNHIRFRGVAMPPESTGRRRPRTVFMTADDDATEQEGDVIWRIMRDGSVKMSKPDDGLHSRAVTK